MTGKGRHSKCLVQVTLIQVLHYGKKNNNILIYICIKWNYNVTVLQNKMCFIILAFYSNAIVYYVARLHGGIILIQQGPLFYLLYFRYKRIHIENVSTRYQNLLKHTFTVPTKCFQIYFSCLEREIGSLYRLFSASVNSNQPANKMGDLAEKGI